MKLGSANVAEKINQKFRDEILADSLAYRIEVTHMASSKHFGKFSILYSTIF